MVKFEVSTYLLMLLSHVKCCFNASFLNDITLNNCYIFSECKYKRHHALVRHKTRNNFNKNTDRVIETVNNIEV